MLIPILLGSAVMFSNGGAYDDVSSSMEGLSDIEGLSELEG